MIHVKVYTRYKLEIENWIANPQSPFFEKLQLYF